MNCNFITFEGIDGSGKTTQVARLVERLSGEIVITREPGGTNLGQRLRTEILHGEDIAPRTETLLYLADSAEHIEKVVRPALARGAVVISDRYIDSTIAYHCGGRGLNEEQMRTCCDFASQGLLPDLTILLDISVEESKKRIVGAKRGKDRLESADTAFFERVRGKFLELSKQPRFCVLDAHTNIEVLSKQILEAVRRHPAFASKVQRFDKININK
jgi:dTMP kinase